MHVIYLRSFVIHQDKSHSTHNYTCEMILNPYSHIVNISLACIKHFLGSI